MATTKLISIRNSDGTLLDVSQNIARRFGALSQPSALDLIAKPQGISYSRRTIERLMKRKPKDYDGVVGDYIGKIKTFISYEATIINRIPSDENKYNDGIILSTTDQAYLNSAPGIDMIAGHTGNFILQTKEEALIKLIADANTQVDPANLKLWSSVAKSNANDLYASIPNGNQPTQTTNTYTEAMTALRGGKRIVTITSAELDANVDNRITLLRNAIRYLTTLGHPNSVEQFYPFSTTGIPFENLYILSNYDNMTKIRDSKVQVFVNMNNLGDATGLNGVIGSVDGIKVVYTNAMPANDVYKILTNRVFGRDIINEINYIGMVVACTGETIKVGSEQVTCGPGLFRVNFLKGDWLSIPFPEEIITIRSV